MGSWGASRTGLAGGGRPRALLLAARCSTTPGTPDRTSLQVRIWNPNDGTVRLRLLNTPDTDLFCSGQALLFDGRLFVVGGTGRYSTGPNDPWGGSKAAYVFGLDTAWQRVQDMSLGRWYPSVIGLPDGRLLVVSGDDDGVRAEQIEIYDPFGAWQVLPASANRYLPLYPRLHVLPSGEIGCAGQGAATAILDLSTNEWREVWPALVSGGSGQRAPRRDRNRKKRAQRLRGRTRRKHGDHESGRPADAPLTPWWQGGHHHPPGSSGVRPDDLSVLLSPAQSGKVLNAGGGVPATAEARIIDLSSPQPAWWTIAPMHHPRWFPNSAILPDGRLLVVGGGRQYNADPVMEPEIFDPETETWTLDVPMQVPRLYHSTSLLLPDGRVWVAGTDGEVRLELYSPDYLSAGPRPVLWAAPQSVAYGQGFPIPMPEPEGVASVCLIRLGAVTHAFNTEQRFIPLSSSVTGPNELQITSPVSPNVAPPGHYMLFIRNAAGVPAVAPIVQLVAGPADVAPVVEEPPPAEPGESPPEGI